MTPGKIPEILSRYSWGLLFRIPTFVLESRVNPDYDLSCLRIPMRNPWAIYQEIPRRRPSFVLRHWKEPVDEKGVVTKPRSYFSGEIPERKPSVIYIELLKGASSGLVNQRYQNSCDLGLRNGGKIIFEIWIPVPMDCCSHSSIVCSGQSG